MGTRQVQAGSGRLCSVGGYETGAGRVWEAVYSVGGYKAGAGRAWEAVYSVGGYETGARRIHGVCEHTESYVCVCVCVHIYTHRQSVFDDRTSIG